MQPEDGIAAGLVPQRILDALFDARQSLRMASFVPVGLFQQAMRALEPELGRGEFDTAFDRSTACQPGLQCR